MIERLKLFIENQGISISAFEQKISASDGMIRRAIKNNTDIQSRWFFKISDNFPDLNLEWLITGNGPMLKSTDLLDYHSDNIEKHIKELNRVKKGIDKDTTLIKLLENNSKLVDANVKLADANLLLAQTNALLSQELIGSNKRGKDTSTTAEAV